MSVANDAASSHGSGAGSGAGSSLIQVAGNGREDLGSGCGASFWNGVFGTLYTVNKERKTSVLFFIFKYTMEFVQLVLLLMGAQYGWRFDTSGKAWQFVQFIQVRPFLTDIGHGLFLVLFLGFIVLLLSCIGIYVWVFNCFQDNKFDYVWPLRLARLFGAFFFETMDIMVMALMLTALDCRYYSWPDGLRLYNNEFPDLRCGNLPNIVYFLLAVLGIILYITMAGFNKLALMDLNPATKNLDSYAHPGTELWGFAIKMLMVIASVLLGDYRHLAIFWFICSVVLCYFFWKWEPMVVSWVNYLRMGTYTAVAYVACLFMALQFPPDAIKAAHKRHANASSYVSYVTALEIALVGILPAFALGALASYLRLRYYRVTIVHRFKVAPTSAKERSIYEFSSPREVEVVSRCCRIWVDCETLQPEAVALAERVVKAGLACLPNSPFMVIWYTSYLVDVQGSYQSGFLQLQVALKLDPSFIDKYAIFSREQDHSAKSANGGHGQNDALLDVEFQKSYRLAMFAHKDALAAIRTFWQLLLHAKVRFEDLTSATRKIDQVIKVAERTYKTVLQRHADQPRLLRLYAKFLERVKHDPWGAARWTMEADKLEQLKVECRHTNMLGLDEDGGDVGSGRISLFSVAEDGQERALSVFNPQGTMTMTNEAMRDMFGYAKAELKGKSVATLLPPAFAEQLIQLVKSFVVSGRGTIVMRTCEVVAVRKDRSMFGARITIVRISGVGEDSNFLAALEAVPVEATTATVWLLASGQVLSVDARFRDWFGFRPSDLEDGATSAWTPNSKQLDDVLRAARHSMVLASQAAMTAAAQDSADDDVTDPSMQLLGRGQSLAASDRMDSIAQALASAAAHAPLVAAPGTCSEWILRGIRVVHKFSDPVEVELKVTNTRPSAFCMHILTLSRSGAAAARPTPHMVVTSPQGPVVHVTEAFAALLGTEPKVLMANGSPSAMEALMVQPFGLMHRAGLSSSMPSQQPPSYSCRSGLSVLMPVVGNATPEALPFKMQMKKRVNLDEVHYVCTLEATSWEQALDERSLRVVVDELGTVTEVGPSPASLFGFSPAVLVGHSITCCVAALHGAAGATESTGAAPLLAELAAGTHVTAPGASWRVSVGLAREEDSEAAMLSLASGVSASSVLLQTKALPAVMTVAARRAEPAASVPESVAEGAPSQVDVLPLRRSGSATAAGYELRLWRADMITSVLEVDGTGMVVETEGFLDKLYPAGAALGVCASSMLGHHVREFLPLGDHRVDDLSDDSVFPPVPVRGAHATDTSKKKSNMRAARPNADRQRVGPQVLLHGRHRLDGADLDLSVQLVRKGGSGAYLVIHVINPQSARLGLLRERVPGHDRLYDVDLQSPAPPPGRHLSVDSPLRGASSSQVSLLKAGTTLSSAKSLPVGSGLVLLSHHLPSPKPSNLSRDALESSRRLNQNVSMRFSETAGDELPPAAAAVAATGTAPAPAELEDPPAAGLSRVGSLIGTKILSRNGSGVSADVSSWVLRDGAASNGGGLTPRGAAELRDDGPGQYEDGDVGGLSGRHDNGDSDGENDPNDVGDSEEGLLVCAVGNVRGAKGAFDGGGSYKRGGANGGGSEGSQLDEAENAADTDADYRRGQRVKKIARILTAEAVASNTRQLKWRTVAITAVLAATSVAVYILYTLLLTQQIESVQGLYRMGLGARKMMRVATTVMDLGMLYQPYPNTYLSPMAGLENDGKDVTDKMAVILNALLVVEASNLGAFSGFLGSERRMPVKYGLRALWETPALTENFFVYIPSSENNTDPYTTISPYASYDMQTFTRKISLFDGVNRMIAYSRDIVANGPWYNTTVCTIYAKLAYWIDWVSCLYVRNNTGSAYLDGWMSTLDGFAQIVIDAAHNLNQLQVAILLAQGVALAILAELCMWYLTNKVDTKRHRVYSVFVVVPLAMVRVLATQRITLDEGDNSDDDADDVAAAVKGAGTGARGASSSAVGDSDGVGKGAKVTGSGKGVHINIAGETNAVSFGNSKTAPPPSKGSRVAAALFFWRTPAKESSSSLAERRTLSRSSRGVLWLTWPFLAWGVGILVLNAVGHSQLQQVEGPVMTFNTVNFFMCRMWRVLYSVQAVQFNKDPLTSAATLKEDLALVQLEYQAMLYGHTGVPDQMSPHFTKISVGIATSAGAGQNILYLTHACLAETALGCLMPKDPFYQYTVHGYDTLVRRTFDVVAAIIQVLEGGAVITNNGPEMQFMWKARESLVGGTVLLTEAYKSHVQQVYSTTLTLQTVALIWTLIVMVLYLAFILRPYLAEVTAETRRITELLTQLPVDIDVEGLVQRALAAGSVKGRSAASAAAAAVAPSSSSVMPLPQPLPYVAAPDSVTRGLLLSSSGKPTTTSSLRHFNIQSLSAQDGSCSGTPSKAASTCRVANILGGSGGSGSIEAPFLRDAGGSGSISEKLGVKPV